MREVLLQRLALAIPAPPYRSFQRWIRVVGSTGGGWVDFDEA